MEQPVWDEAARGWRIPGLKVILRVKPLEGYATNARNPVSHDERNRKTVLESIRQLGALRSGVSSAGTILAGNLTSQAMREAGIETVLEVESEGETWLMHERPDLTEEQRQLAAYFDQASAMQATWSAEQVAADVEAGLDLKGLWYDWELDIIKGGQDAVEDPSQEWKGMPDYEQKDNFGAMHTVLVHFASDGDVEAFSRLVNQTVNRNTKFIWFPKQDRLRLKDYVAHEGQ